MKRIDKAIVAAMVALGIALIWVVSGTLETPVIIPGDKAPRFSVVTDRGTTITPAQFGGKLLVVNFWATWCGGCIEEITSRDAFQRAFASRGVVVVGISMDANEKLYRRFLQEYPLSFATARDPSWNISATYGTFQLPETYFIDRSGKVVEKIIASQNFMDPAFLAHVEKML